MERQTLQDTVDHLYATFDRYKPGGRVMGCPCCVAEGDIEQLHGRPLRDVEVSALQQYLPKAMTTWGTEGDFMYFVPRLLEWFATSPSGDSPDRYYLALKLKASGWATWAVEERTAVEDFLGALWRYVLDHYAPYPEGHWIGGVLEVIAALTDVGPYLDEWNRNESVSALRHLASFIYSSLRVQTDGTVLVRPNPNAAQIAAWILNGRTLERLEQGYLAHSAEEWAPIVAETSDYLRRAYTSNS